MNSSPNISNLSDTSHHLSKRPPEMMKSLWPSDGGLKIPMTKLSLVSQENNEGVEKAGLSPRRKKYSVSKRVTKRNTRNLITAEKTSLFITQDLLSKMLSKLTLKAKTSLSTIAKNIRKKRYYEDIRNLSPLHFDLIGDPSGYYQKPESEKKRHFLSVLLLYGKTRRAFLNLWVINEISNLMLTITNKAWGCFKSKKYQINPNTPLKIFWDLVLSMLTIFQVFCFSIEKSFVVDLEMASFEFILTIAFYIDIFISMNTKIFKEGVVVTDRVLIIKSLLTKRFFNEIAPGFFLSIIIFTNRNDYDFLNIFLLIKAFKLKKNLNKVKDLFIRSRKSDVIFQLITLVLKLVFWAHIIAVLWHYVGLISVQTNLEENSWLKEAKVDKKDWKSKYLFSVYWGVTTMLTVGYGDITPTNNKEMLYNIFAMFVGCCIFGYSINKIGEIFNQYHKKTNALEEKMKKVSYMLRDKKLPLEIQLKIKRYLQFVWKQEQKEDPEHEHLVMDKLNTDLRNEIYLHTNVKHLKTVPAFSNFNEKTLIMFARFMKKVCFCPEEFVIREGDYENPSIYFVLDGSLKLVKSKEDKFLTVWKKFRRDDYFGVREVFTGAPRSISVVSNDFSTLFKLSRSDIIQVLKKFPHDYEKFCELKDLEIMSNRKNFCDVECFSCGSKEHPVDYCNFLNYYPPKHLIIYKHINSKRKKAKSFRRKLKPLYNALYQKNLSMTSQSDFMDVYDDDDDLKELVSIYTQDNDNASRVTKATKENTDAVVSEGNNKKHKENLIKMKTADFNKNNLRRRSINSNFKLNLALCDDNHKENKLMISSSDTKKEGSDNDNTESDGSGKIQETEENEKNYSKLNSAQNWDDVELNVGAKTEKPLLIIPPPKKIPSNNQIQTKEENRGRLSSRDLAKGLNGTDRADQGLLKDMEGVKIYEKYFVHNNITEILKKFNSSKKCHNGIFD